MIEYQISNLEWQKFKTTNSLANAHGLLCGYACVNPDITLENWLFETLEEYDKNDDFSILAGIFNTTLEGLSDAELNFNLLINEDDNLQVQALDIKDWCSGFLTGLGLAKITIDSEEITEILENINYIATLDSNIKNTDENENDISEIVEFLKVATLLIQETINPSKQDFVNPLPLH